MANSDSLGQFYLDSIGYGRVAYIRATALNTSGNGATTGITLPFLSGGLTNANAAVGSGSVVLRRVTIQNPTGSLASANISITTSKDGNISNAVVANVVLSSITAAGTYQDLNIATPYNANTAVTGFTTQALYVNINTVSGNANTADIVVFGDVVSF
jgi:hypothetical protein